MKEIWKPVQGFESKYEISNFGNIRNTKGKQLSPWDNREGYLCIDLWDGKRTHKKIHRLVAEAFIPNPNNLPLVNHINEEKYDNRVDNLEWVTAAENCNHGTRNEKVSWENKNGIPVIGTSIQSGKKIYFASAAEAERNGFNHSLVIACCRGKRNFHKGYYWDYA